MLLKYCTQYASKFGKLNSGHRNGKGPFITIQKKSNAKEYSSYCTIVLISHATKVMLKILQAILDESQAGIKTAGRNISNFQYAYDTTLMAESEEELKSLLLKVKEESEKADLKLNIGQTKIRASGPITLWQTAGETMETMRDFLFSWAPKSPWMVTVAMKLRDACSLEEKQR